MGWFLKLFGVLINSLLGLFLKLCWGYSQTFGVISQTFWGHFSNFICVISETFGGYWSILYWGYFSNFLGLSLKLFGCYVSNVLRGIYQTFWGYLSSFIGVGLLIKSLLGLFLELFWGYWSNFIGAISQTLSGLFLKLFEVIDQFFMGCYLPFWGYWPNFLSVICQTFWSNFWGVIDDFMPLVELFGVWFSILCAFARLGQNSDWMNPWMNGVIDEFANGGSFAWCTEILLLPDAFCWQVVRKILEPASLSWHLKVPSPSSLSPSSALHLGQRHWCFEIISVPLLPSTSVSGDRIKYKNTFKKKILGCSKLQHVWKPRFYRTPK